MLMFVCLLVFDFCFHKPFLWHEHSHSLYISRKFLWSIILYVLLCVMFCCHFGEHNCNNMKLLGWQITCMCPYLTLWYIWLLMNTVKSSFVGKSWIWVIVQAQSHLHVEILVSWFTETERHHKSTNSILIAILFFFIFFYYMHTHMNMHIYFHT